MKKSIKTIALILVTSAITLTSFANTPAPDPEKSFDVGMYYDYKSGQIKAFFEKEASEKLSISLVNEKGEKISNAYMRSKAKVGRAHFDINSLPDGVYTLKVSNGEEESTYSITIKKPEPWKLVQFD